MALGSNCDPREQELWLTADDLPKSPGHPFYDAVQRVLREAGERGSEWRCTDSLSLRSFLMLDLKDRVPDHSSLCRIRQRLDLETHNRIFLWVLERLNEHGLLKGKNLGVDASTMEANAAMRSIVRKGTGESYQEYLTGLAKESGIETPTRADLKKLDRKRKKKGSNKDWESPSDPDARISKLKDGRTKLSYKPEHTVDLDTQAVIAAEIHPANHGDTTTGPETLATGCENLITLGFDSDEKKTCVADMGYHKSDQLGDLHRTSIWTYIAEPKRKRRKWRGRSAEETAAKKEDQAAVYANRRRIRSGRGKNLGRLRTERVERSFAHVLDSGGMRRTQLRGKENVQKRYLIQVAAYNIGLLMRKLIGAGKPREWAGKAALAAHRSLLETWRAVLARATGARVTTVRLSEPLGVSCGAGHAVQSWVAA